MQLPARAGGGNAQLLVVSPLHGSKASSLSECCGLPRATTTQPHSNHALRSRVAPLLKSLRSYAGDRQTGLRHGPVSLPFRAARKRGRLASTGGRGLAGANLTSTGNQDSEKPAGATSPRGGGRHPGLSAEGPTSHRLFTDICPASSPLWCRRSSLGVPPSGCAMRLPAGRFKAAGSSYPPAHGGHTASPPRRASQNHCRPARASFHQHNCSLRSRPAS